MRGFGTLICDMFEEVNKMIREELLLVYLGLTSGVDLCVEGVWLALSGRRGYTYADDLDAFSRFSLKK